MDPDKITLEQTLNAPTESVWQALTDPQQMRQWYFPQIPDFQPQVGFETSFVVECEGKDFNHQWKVTEAVPSQRIAYQWRYEGYPGDSVVVWEIASNDNGTDLKFTHAGIESMQGDELFSRENCQAGWEYLINEGLKKFVESR